MGGRQLECRPLSPHFVSIRRVSGTELQERPFPSLLHLTLSQKHGLVELMYGLVTSWQRREAYLLAKTSAVQRPPNPTFGPEESAETRLTVLR